MPPKLRDNAIVFEYKHTIRASEVRALLAEYGYEPTDDMVGEWCREYMSVWQSALDASEEQTWGGLAGMTIRAAVEHRDWPVTDKVRRDLLDPFKQPELT